MEKMSTEDISNLVLNYINREYREDENEEITFDTPLITGGYVDSFSMISLLVYLEKTFKIKIPAAKATPEAFNSVNNIVALVRQYLN